MSRDWCPLELRRSKSQNDHPVTERHPQRDWHDAAPGTTAPSQDVVLEFHECCGAYEPLPRASRLVLRLIALDGLSSEEGASQLGNPVGTVRSRFLRTRQMLGGSRDAR